MKKLREYLDGRRKGDFAASIGTSASYLSQLLSEHRQPSLEMMRRIERATGGKVTRYDMRPDIYDLPSSETPRGAA